MKIAFAKKINTPPLGTPLGGYGGINAAESKYDDLYLTAVCFDNGRKKVAIFGYDLLGIDQSNCKRLRAAAASILGVEEPAVILSCTHTHTGPDTRRHVGNSNNLNVEYIEQLIKFTEETARELAGAEYKEVNSYFYSKNCDYNINRRFVTGDNRCSFVPNRRDIEKIADGICDKELGGMAFFCKETNQPYCIIGNYAAHPLAGRTPGISGRRISADYPGAFRRYIEQETGANAMFLSGACGDTIPRGHERGAAAIEKMGTGLAMETIDAVINSVRQAPCYTLSNDALEASIEKVKLPKRGKHICEVHKDYEGQDELETEIQLLSIGDVCFIGVPGELTSELGLEMKWHSPFRKTFILYCSTAYMNYICHGNAVVQGGYEVSVQYVGERGGLKLVNTAIDGAYKLHDRAFPNAEDTKKPLVALVNQL